MIKIMKAGKVVKDAETLNEYLEEAVNILVEVHDYMRKYDIIAVGPEPKVRQFLVKTGKRHN